jgi:uncharacterized membrane protein
VGGRLDRTVTLVGIALIGAAVATELKKPPEEREWHGRIAGAVPYEFRLPTMVRAKERWWNPDDARIFTEHVFGVGWSVNLAQVVRLVRL